MKTSFNRYARFGIPFAGMGIYALIFPVLYPSAGQSTAALSFIPVVLGGWLLGVRGGLLFGLINVPLNIFLFDSQGDIATATNFLSTLIANLVITLTGVGSGWFKELLERVNKQAQELGEERKILQEEMEKRIRAEERLIYEALHDPLTNLPNRRRFIDRLEHAIKWNKRHPEDLIAILYFDFDCFKIVNDSLGHNVGDQLLIEMARRLKDSVRAMDTVARMGGDEFAILLEALKSNEEVIPIIKRLQNNFAAPFQVDGNTIAMTASIGVVVNLSRYERIDDIMRDADIAMYNAKVSGRNNYKVFDIAMWQEAEVALKLESDLRHAIQNQEFRIYYQPIFSLQTQYLIGFEALIRWQHPERGLLHPADFIKTAEESGLIIPIGQWVLYEACRQMKEWQTQFEMESLLIISVNLSSRQFSQPDLIPQIEQTLIETGLPAGALLLELTEMTLIEDMEAAILKIEHLHKLGVGIAIDDFGTGYSSLGYLRHLPVNNLKIDRSFISTLGTSKSAVPIIRAIVAMANSLNMKVIAEGIETPDQMNNLTQLECDYGQGFFFNRPVDSNAILSLIKKELSKQKK